MHCRFTPHVRFVALAASALTLTALAGRAQNKPAVSAVLKTAAWHDPSPHRVQFVTVDRKNNVRLEVLDWGGSGRPVVLLAGLGYTAHVYDDFALKLTPKYHVYGITRRGFGDSSAPASGYSADQLGDDVLAVLTALNIQRPVLVGHSIAGEELSSIGSRYPQKVSGLIYLDAGYPYAYYDRARGDFQVDTDELERYLNRLRPPNSPSGNQQLVGSLLNEDLPAVERDLLRVQKEPPPAPMPELPPPSAADTASFSAFQSWMAQSEGIHIPIAEFHQNYETRPDGGVGKERDPAQAGYAILAGEQKYTRIQVPILAIYAIPHDAGPAMDKNPSTQAFLAPIDAASAEQAEAFKKGLLFAQVVSVPHANHFVFLSNENEVLRDVNAFIGGLH
ncbi:MAG: alpha/beta hydrolase [Acidobacteriaceae bacterium]